MDTWFARRPARDLRPGDHAWLLYASEEERRHVLGAFIQDGLAAGDRLIYVGEGAPVTPHLVMIEPADCGAEDGFDPELVGPEIRAEIERAIRQGYRGARVIAELTSAICGPAGAELPAICARRFDALVGSGLTVTAVCQIDRGRCPAEVLSALARLHPVLVTPDPEFEDTVLRITRTFEPPGLAIGGALDASRHEVFAEALTKVIENGEGESVHLDLAELEFMDLGALSLMDTISTADQTSGPIVLNRVPPHLTEVIGALGWRRLPGLSQGDVPKPRRPV